MFDTMVLTKIVAGFCSALLIFLLGNWVSEFIYEPHVEHESAGYVIDTGETDADAEPEVELAFADIWATADVSAGERKWSSCRACHSLEEGRNGVGPSLHGVVGRSINAIEGFNYTGALSQMGDTWTPEAIYDFIVNPRVAAPGTAMSFSGLPDAQDRVNLIAYIASQSE
jgi:cytochrome c